jgi:DNA-binding transcriptional ArsR family regulator
MADDENSRPSREALHKALGHLTRRSILAELASGQEISPKDFSVSTRTHLSPVGYHFRVLAECGAIKMTRTAEVRGATQHFYRFAIGDPWVFEALGLADSRRASPRIAAALAVRRNSPSQSCSPCGWVVGVSAWKSAGEEDHPIRVAVLAALNWIDEPCSPVLLASCFAEKPSTVNYHVQILMRDGRLEVASTHRKRGAVERRYRPT